MLDYQRLTSIFSPRDCPDCTTCCDLRQAVCELFASRGAASIAICTLLDKKAHFIAILKHEAKRWENHGKIVVFYGKMMV